MKLVVLLLTVVIPFSVFAHQACGPDLAAVPLTDDEAQTLRAVGDHRQLLNAIVIRQSQRFALSTYPQMSYEDVLVAPRKKLDVVLGELRAILDREEHGPWYAGWRADLELTQWMRRHLAYFQDPLATDGLRFLSYLHARPLSARETQGAFALAAPVEIEAFQDLHEQVIEGWSRLRRRPSTAASFLRTLEAYRAASEQIYFGRCAEIIGRRAAILTAIQ